MSAVHERGAVVVQAEPGAGKTTRVPPALLAELGAGKIVVAQPRRIAARLAASRVAHELGEPLGQRCGYQVRFESKRSDATRILFMTEGLLARRLRDDADLEDVGAIVLDEIHERHVDTDVCLALVHALRTGRREDLRVVAMSATIETGPLADYLDAETIRCPGRTHPVEIEHATKASDRPLQSQVAAALRRAMEDGLDGSALVFLPGAREIRRAAEACEPLARANGFDLAMLYGDLPGREQDRAVSPGPRPKIVLSTNVAETSVTIEGVVLVIDSGLARRPHHDPWSGLPTLTLSKISQASAAQRAGRAGRTQPGRCIRLYSAHDLARRPAFDAPEIQRLDLAGPLHDLRAVTGRLDALQWFDAPPTAAVQAAEALLERLSATTSTEDLTEIGRRMLRYPAHPRLRRLLVEAADRGIPRLGAAAAALLSERSIRRRRSTSTSTHDAPADVLADLADLEDRHPSLDHAAVRSVQRVRKQLENLLPSRRDTADDPEQELCQALLVAYPDRVARAERRPGRPDRLVFAAGGDAELAESSVVHGADLVVALAAEQRHDAGRSRTIVRSAAHIEPEWLLELHGDHLVESTEVRFDPQRQRVHAVRETRFEGLVIESTPLQTVPPEATAILREAVLAAGPRHFAADADAYDQLLRRAAFVASHRPDLPTLDEAAATAKLSELCEGARSFADLRRADLVGQLLGTAAPDLSRALRDLTPTHVALPGGRRLRVHYELDRPPWVQSRLQDFFGSTEGPSIMGGAVPLVLHLLAPNRRAVQVTTDLAGFWDRHYPDLRRTLMRRYPKHDWPEDPRTAKPPAPGGRRRRR